jgi:hypothetical protein
MYNEYIHVPIYRNMARNRVKYLRSNQSMKIQLQFMQLHGKVYHLRCIIAHEFASKSCTCKLYNISVHTLCLLFLLITCSYSTASIDAASYPTNMCRYSFIPDMKQ